MTDKNLIKLIQNQPDQGIQIAIDQYGGLVNAIILQVLGNEIPYDIQECIAEVFVRLWMYGGNFHRHKGTLKSYIVTIARNEALRRLKQIQKYRAEIASEIYDTKSEVSVSGEVIKQGDEKILRDAIDSLGEPDRQIFIRRYFWDERVKDIAKALGLKEKFIENRLYLGKKKLKNELTRKGLDNE